MIPGEFPPSLFHLLIKPHLSFSPIFPHSSKQQTTHESEAHTAIRGLTFTRRLCRTQSTPLYLHPL